MEDDVTPIDGTPARIVAGRFVSGAERKQRDRQDTRIERWRAKGGGGLSRADRLRLVAGLGCAALVAGCLFVPCVDVVEGEFRLEIAWRWIWQARGPVDGTRLAIQLAVLAAATALAALVASRDRA